MSENEVRLKEAKHLRNKLAQVPGATNPSVTRALDDRIEELEERLEK